MNNQETKLGDAIRDALNRASKVSVEKCKCMHCSGSGVYSQELKLSTMTVGLSQGTTTDDEDEIELSINFTDGQDAHVITVTGDTQVEEFRTAIEELFHEHN